MSRNGKENFQSLYAQEMKQGTFATDTSATKKDRDARKKLTLKRAIAILIVIVLLLYAANYILVWKTGTVLLRFGEEITSGETYTRTKISSLGFSLYEYEGICTDYSILQLGGKEPEAPYTLTETELTELNRLLTDKFASEADYGSAAKYLETDTFLGLHIYDVLPKADGLKEVYCIASIGDYALYNGNVYLMNESNPAIVAQVWDDHGILRLHSLYKKSLQYYFQFEELLPYDKQFSIDLEDISHARQLCDEAAEAALGGTVVLDFLEVSESGHLEILRPDIEGYNPDVDTELKYERVESNQLKPK